MNMHPFIWGLMVCAVVYVITSMRMVSWLKSQEVKVNFILIRMLMPQYAFKFKQLNRQQAGGMGWLFATWLISINLALVFFVLFLFLGR